MLAVATPVPRTETVALADADGRVSVADVRSPIDVPPFNRAAMDGYAVRAADVAGAGPDRPVTLTCGGQVFTGDAPGQSVDAGRCLAISTGAPLPTGADAVVMVERTSETDAGILVRDAVSPGQNVGKQGADLSRGGLIVAREDWIGPARVGGLAAAGYTEVEVFARPSIAVASTGNEIAAPGRPLAPGQVYDVNHFTVAAVTRRHGGVVSELPAITDSLDALTVALDRAANHDAVVVSGGSSVGGRDLVLDALRARGTVIFHGIAVKPGKPTVFGRIGSTAVFGMPGNPTSCLSNTYALLVPFVRKLAHLPPWRPAQVTGTLARSVRSTPDRHQFCTVRLIDGRVEPAFKSSGDITSMAHADGFIQIPARVAGLEAGTVVTVTLF